MTLRPHPSRHNVLITSAASKAPLVCAMQTALARINPESRVIVGDIDPQALSRYVADEFWLMPTITNEALPLLIAGCHERGIGAILPTRDGELAFWAHHREAFCAAGIAIIVSPLASITRCLDKLAFAEFGLAQGLPMIPASQTPQMAGDGLYVVKERFGAGSQGLGLSLSFTAALEHAKGLDSPLFQPYITGPEISIDSWIDQNGTVLGVVLRRRDRVIDGESKITTTFRDPALERQACQAIQALDLRGPIVMQAIIVQGGLHIIECNPRFGGASTAAISAGLDSLYWSLGEAFGLASPPLFQRNEQEVRLVRLPTDVVMPWS